MSDRFDAWTSATAVMNKPGVETYHVPLTLRFLRDGSQWVAWCEELDVHTQANSFEDVHQRVRDATLFYLNCIEELGERRRIFDERGIAFHRGVPAPRGTISKVVHEDELVTTMYAGASLTTASA